MLAVDALEQYAHPHILPVVEASKRIASARKAGKKVGLCHGGFDLLHPGHVKHFESARKLCDILVVSVTSERFVADRKGIGRPIFTDKLRAYMIANLQMVDFVVISDFKKGVEVINALKPTYYIKGPDMIGKMTPGILAEREAIKAVGGEDRYTDDPPSSTTKIIEYIKQEVKDIKLLVVCDRDGTLIADDGFVGKDSDWKTTLVLNRPVIDTLSFLKTKYRSTFVVVTNQSGVARGLFDDTRVQEINDEVATRVAPQGIKIASWQMCPCVHDTYAAKHPEVKWKRGYVKKEPGRKPARDMFDAALADLGKKQSDFSATLVFGDHHDDEGLAKTIGAQYFDVKGANYEALKSAVDLYITTQVAPKS